MGWRRQVSRWWIVYVVVAASMICPLEVFSMAPSPEASSPAQLTNSGSAFAPRSVSSPKAFSPSYEPVLPSIHPIVSSMMSPAPSAHVAAGDKWPRAVAPAVESQPNAPISSVLPSSRPSQPSPSSNKPQIAPRMAPNTAFAPHGTILHGSATPPVSVTSPVISGKRNDTPVASPPVEGYKHFTPTNSSPSKGSSPMLSPVPNKVKPSTSAAPGPSGSHLQPPAISISDGPASSPEFPVQQRRARKRVKNPSSPTLTPFSPPLHLSAPTAAPAPEVFPKYIPPYRVSPPSHQGLSFPQIQSPAPSPPLPASSDLNEWSSHSPTTTPGSYAGASSAVLPPPIWLLPPPPPNLDCKLLVCAEPLTNPPPGSPCDCVLPIRVGLSLSVTLYTFFPLVPELAKEISYGIYMNQSQVRIMGANVANEQPENTVVLVDLVPDKEKFESTKAFSIFEKFWRKDIVINTSLFGDYDVLYVLYPGLPPSPPRAPGDSTIGDVAFSNNYNARAIKPLGVDVGKPKKKASGSLIAVIVLSSLVALTLCVGAVWFLWSKQRDRSHLAATKLQNILPLFANSSGNKHMLLGRLSSESPSVNSSVATYTGQAKIFTSAEIERATNRFGEARIIGEGGFGRVYQGTLEDGIRVAVKVLKRDDQQGGREFFVEIEMLSRLHHRNLVKLIGICIEDHIRCLVYELIPNGSLESHLHGLDKETAPLDWNTRMRIALGAARGLAYLHEDSSPRVIHRDFKSSNILLEHDYTPKVSDFGLARAAVDEGNLHISTRVMGTFGYVAPEYAMTGHLLVKSDVYSYGVVLLELLTGRKPIDMLQRPGQENLVSWARPLLSNMNNLEMIIDPTLDTNIPLDSVAKVAAIASMCVQPEVSHRPFMGEVVQALNLVCNECSENARTGSCSRNDLSTQDAAAMVSNVSALEAERVLLESYLLSESTRFDSCELDPFQRQSSSGPLTTSKGRQYWQQLRSSSSTGSMSEHGVALRFVTSSYCSEGWS
ncbi:receptor-like serine/threonine-protein kinase ALE2 isoform X2 [Canna indica]|uniref:Receptor-like serine/threonine-protein kinase ALE2 isoform X2 n=1 Tax=Canna indica TaxID=4628 RepID=A0AAQ3QJX8_9LILI|nr:receptor-like serine/threonine-protein kinase ALE2 isoform X2 [Canna indica]